MARMEKIKGILRAIDDDRKILEVLLPDNVIHVQTTFPDNWTPNIKHYRYLEKLEWETPGILSYLGKSVEIQLSDGVADKIETID